MQKSAVKEAYKLRVKASRREIVYWLLVKNDRGLLLLAYRIGEVKASCTTTRFKE